jgi:hypothetical protein
MGIGIDAKSGAGAAAASLDFANRTYRLRIHRVLHEETGPSLCAAGLHLELLAVAATPDARAESAAALREALEAAHASIRALMVESDPALLSRGGLDAALTVLGRHLPVDWQEPGAPCPLTNAQEELCYRVAREWASACASAAPPASLTVRRSGAGLRLSSTHPCTPWLPAWRYLAAQAGALLRSDDNGHSLTFTPLAEPSQ